MTAGDPTAPDYTTDVKTDEFNELDEFLLKCEALDQREHFVKNRITSIKGIKLLTKEDLQEIGILVGPRNFILAEIEKLNSEDMKNG